MKNLLLTVMTLAMAGTASAAIPQLNYQCPGQIQLHSDEGGPVYINGKEAKLKKYSDDFYEARGAGVTLSISRSGNQYDVSYTSKKGSGICQPSAGSAASSQASSTAPGKASPAEKACLKAVSTKAGVALSELQVVDVMDSEAGVGVTIKVPGADAPWSCLSDKKGHVQGAAYTGK